MKDHAQEIAFGERFEFGANWARFLEHLDDGRIVEAERSLANMLGLGNLGGKTFLDIGSGSGLFSLAARRLGAKVYSFDYDPQSVTCTQELRRRYFPDDADWQVGKGSALDVEYLKNLGEFDIVYSWGVLHHTGDMWQALENAVIPVGERGKLCIAIYNDQGWISRYWLVVKRFYNTGFLSRWLVIAAHFPYLFAARWLKRVVRRQGGLERGMSIWYDMLDWLGGLPFEVATPESISEFYSRLGLTPKVVKNCGSFHGCNEFVLDKESDKK